MSEGSGERGDDGLRRLVRLTRESLSEADFPADEVSLRLLREERAARAARATPARARGMRSSTAIVGALCALALLAAGGLVAWRLARPATPLTFEIIQGATTPRTDTRLHFSDGSEIVLENEARAEVRDLRADGGRIVLLRGRSRAYIVPRPAARWQVAAGPYLVEVAGTVFDVDWSEDGQALELWLQKGSVRVSGPLIGSGIVLTAGQHLSTRVRDNKIVLDRRAEDH